MVCSFGFLLIGNKSFQLLLLFSSINPTLMCYAYSAAVSALLVLKMLIDIVNHLKELLHLSLPVYRCRSPNILLSYKMFGWNSIVK